MSKKPGFLRSSLPIIVLALFGTSAARQTFADQPEQGKGETIVMVRHGEKPPQGLGQLTCKGLNRALALPDVLIKRYGKPDFIFAPNPSVQVADGSKTPYFYVRPLVTIEPTAIRLSMPINTRIGFNEIDKLQKELMEPVYANSLIFMAWEHVYLFRFARQMLESNGKDPSVVPDWPYNDYDSIYVLHIARSKEGREVTFTIGKEMLDHSISDSCPTR